MTAATEFPVVERIAQVLFARLELLLGQGYNTCASKIVRAAEHFKAQNVGELTGGWAPEDKLILLTHSQADIGTIEEGNPPLVEEVQVFQAVCFLAPSPRDKTPTDTLLNVFVADVRKALTQTADADFDWAQMEGLAIQARLLAPVKFDSTDWWGAIQPLSVTYRVSETDPYQQR